MLLLSHGQYILEFMIEGWNEEKSLNYPHTINA